MSEKVTCPFNSVHVVERHRLMNHMSRCIKTYKGGRHTSLHCPLDYSHVVEAGKMNEHLATCSQLALAAPLLSVDLNTDVVTGNLRLPEQPKTINELVTAEWDTPELDQQQQQQQALHANQYADDASTVGFSVGGSESGSTCNFSSVLAGFGRGRGRGRFPTQMSGNGNGSGSVGFGVGDEDSLRSADYQPGDTVPGGYTLRRVFYPSGFGPRGRFEVRGDI